MNWSAWCLAFFYRKPKRKWLENIYCTNGCYNCWLEVCISLMMFLIVRSDRYRYFITAGVSHRRLVVNVLICLNQFLLGRYICSLSSQSSISNKFVLLNYKTAFFNEAAFKDLQTRHVVLFYLQFLMKPLVVKPGLSNKYGTSVKRSKNNMCFFGQQGTTLAVKNAVVYSVSASTRS